MFTSAMLAQTPGRRTEPILAEYKACRGYLLQTTNATKEFAILFTKSNNS